MEGPLLGPIQLEEQNTLIGPKGEPSLCDRQGESGSNERGDHMRRRVGRVVTVPKVKFWDHLKEHIEQIFLGPLSHLADRDRRGGVLHMDKAEPSKRLCRMICRFTSSVRSITCRLRALVTPILVQCLPIARPHTLFYFQRSHSRPTESIPGDGRE